MQSNCIGDVELGSVDTVGVGFGRSARRDIARRRNGVVDHGVKRQQASHVAVCHGVAAVGKTTELRRSFVKAAR